MNEIVVGQEAPPEALDVKALARELADSFRSRVNYHRKVLELSAEEALAKAEERCPLDRMWRTLDCPAEEVTWEGLEELNRTSPERALLRWEEVQQAAVEELRGGHRAARAVEERFARAYQRAQFLALREELAREWCPRNGIERQL